MAFKRAQNKSILLHFIGVGTYMFFERRKKHCQACSCFMMGCSIMSNYNLDVICYIFYTALLN
jgi:hypothetical protein